MNAPPREADASSSGSTMPLGGELAPEGHRAAVIAEPYRETRDLTAADLNGADLRGPGLPGATLDDAAKWARVR